MATLINRNGVWYADFHDRTRIPHRKRLSFRTRSERAALRLLSVAEEAYRLGRWDPWIEGIEVLAPKRASAPLRLTDAFDRYVAHRSPSSSPYTVRNYRLHLGRFVDRIGRDIPLPKVTEKHVAAYVFEEGLSPTTQRYRHTVLRAFFRWCISEGLCREDMTGRVEPPRPLPSLPKAVTAAELEAVCTAVLPAKRWMCPVWWFSLYTGLRGSEVARLRWGHVDRERGLLLIERQKNGRASTLPLNRKALAVLEGLERGEPEAFVFFSPHTTSRTRKTHSFVTMLSDEFRRARIAAGIERPITPHGLRHAFCTLLAEAGKSAYVVMAAARHTNIRTSTIYVSLRDEHLRAELNEVFG